MPLPPHDADDDLPWVRRAQAGDIEAFDTLVTRHQSAMSALLFRFAPNRADLEDLVQETFVRAWRALAGWRAEKPFLHWLKRIAVRVGLDYCRSQRRSPLARPVEMGAADPLEGLAAPDPASAPCAAAEVQAILAQLPPDDRALLTLIHLNEMPLAEVAEHFGWSRPNTKIRAFRARLRLKALLKRHGYTL